MHIIVFSISSLAFGYSALIFCLKFIFHFLFQREIGDNWENKILKYRFQKKQISVASWLLCFEKSKEGWEITSSCSADYLPRFCWKWNYKYLVVFNLSLFLWKWKRKIMYCISFLIFTCVKIKNKEQSLKSKIDIH